MNCNQIGDLGCRTPKDRGKGLAYFERLAEMSTNKVHQVGLVGYEGIVRMDLPADGSRVGSEARGEAASRCSAKGPEINHRAFSRVDIAGQLIYQLALFQTEHADRVASGLCSRS